MIQLILRHSYGKREKNQDNSHFHTVSGTEIAHGYIEYKVNLCYNFDNN